MSDYPSIRLEDVRDGDVVRGTGYYSGNSATVQGAVWMDPDGALFVGGHRLRYLTDLRLISRPRPPEPPLRALRAGDWVRHYDGDEWQITSIERTGNDTYAKGLGSPFPGTGWAVRSLTCIEPPVGWPVCVTDVDNEERWYYRWRTDSVGYYCPTLDTIVEWDVLVAAGGVPALAVTR